MPLQANFGKLLEMCPPIYLALEQQYLYPQAQNK